MKEKRSLPYYLMSFIIIVGSLLFAFRNTDISLKDKQVLTGILKEKPKEHHFRTSLKFYDDIRFALAGENPLFTIENFEYKASSYDRLLIDLDSGDAITIWVDKGQVNDKAKDYVRVYQLQYKGVNYVDIQGSNAVKSRYNKRALIVTLFGIILIVYLYKTGKKLSFERMILISALMIIGIYRITK